MHIAYMHSGTGLRAELQILPFVESYDVTVYFQNKSKKYFQLSSKKIEENLATSYLVVMIRV